MTDVVVGSGALLGVFWRGTFGSMHGIHLLPLRERDKGLVIDVVEDYPATAFFGKVSESLELVFGHVVMAVGSSTRKQQTPEVIFEINEPSGVIARFGQIAHC